MILTLLITALYAFILLLAVVPFRHQIIRLFRPARGQVPVYVAIACLHLALVAILLALNRSLTSHDRLLLAAAAIPVGAALATMALLRGRWRAPRLRSRIRAVLNRIADRGRVGRALVSPTTTCTVALMIFWVLMGIVPPVVFSHVAWDVTSAAALDYELATTAARLETRATDLRAELRGVVAKGDLLHARLQRKDDLYLFSLAAQSWLPRGVAAELGSLPPSWISDMAARLPIYNDTSRSLRHRHADASAVGSYPWPEVVASAAGAGNGAAAGRDGDARKELLFAGWRDSVGLDEARVALPVGRADPRWHWTEILVLCVLILLPLALWLRAVSRRIFFLDVEDIAPATPAPDLTGGRRLLITCSTPDWQRLLPESDVPRTDLAGSDRPVTPVASRFVCEGLEETLEDAERRNRSLELLEEWLADGKTVILVAARNPLEALGARLSEQELDGSWRPGVPDPPLLPCSERRRWTELLSRFPAVNLPVSGPRDGEDPAAYWWCVWNGLSADEQFALAQLSMDGLLNPKQNRPLELLARRGLVEPRPLPTVKHPELAKFVRGLVRTRYREEWARATTRGDWRHYQRYFAVGAVLILAFLLVTERDLFNYVTAIAGAMAAGVAGLLRLLAAWKQPAAQ